MRCACCFLAAHEGPYLIHCREGKDRTGFVTAMLECLMGATADEVIADYMTTYCNFYGVEPGSDKYEAIARGNIEKILKEAFGADDLRQADLAERAAEFLQNAGMTGEEIETLKDRLK